MKIKGNEKEIEFDNMVRKAVNYELWNLYSEVYIYHEELSNIKYELKGLIGVKNKGEEKRKVESIKKMCKSAFFSTKPLKEKMADINNALKTGEIDKNRIKKLIDDIEKIQHSTITYMVYNF